MEVKINEEAMQQLLTKAIIDQMTPEAKEGMIAKAIAYLVQPQPSRNGYGTTDSIIVSSFKAVAEQVMNQIIREELENSTEFRAQVKELLGAVVERMMKFGGERDKIVDGISSLIISKIRDY